MPSSRQSPRKALEAIAHVQLNGSKQDYRQIAAFCVGLAQAALEASANRTRAQAAKSEFAKQARDRERALSAIAVLERVERNKAETKQLRGACVEERMRLTRGLNEPEALRRIYRRNEVRR